MEDFQQCQRTFAGKSLSLYSCPDQQVSWLLQGSNVHFQWTVKHNIKRRPAAADLLLLLCIWWLSKPPKVSARRGRHTGPTPPPSWTLAIAPPRLPFTSACNVSTVTHTHTQTHTHTHPHNVQVSKWIILANCVTLQLCTHESHQALNLA